MSEQRRRGPMGGRGRMMSGEKAKDFKGSMAKLFRYMGRYKFRFILMFIFAVAGTVFSIVGPKILGKATTELFNGLVAKVNGTGEIDFGKIGMILLWTLGLYVLSACFSFVQGFVMSGISNDVTYNLRKDISKKINRLPLNYYESRTNGEILSRITNDVDTLQMSLNQSLTQLITSVTTLIGVFIMMLSINVWMTLAALLILPVSMFIIQTVMKHSQKYFQDQQKYLGEVNGQVEEIYSGHTVVKAFNKEDDVINEFEKTNEKLYSSAWRSQFFSGIMMPIISLVPQISNGFDAYIDVEQPNPSVDLTDTVNSQIHTAASSGIQNIVTVELAKKGVNCENVELIMDTNEDNSISISKVLVTVSRATMSQDVLEQQLNGVLGLQTEVTIHGG